MLPDTPPLPPDARYSPLPYESRLADRPLTAIDLVVIHCTETPSLASAREFGERVLYPETGTGASGHYYIDTDGTLWVYVRPDRVAHHTRGYNPRSVGIEIQNPGRYPDWYDSRRQHMDTPYTGAQLLTLARLLGHLRETLPSLHFIAGHEDLDRARVPASDDPSAWVWRKRDPGPMFPWERIEVESGLRRLPPVPAD